MPNRNPSLKPLRRRFLINKPMQLGYSGFLIWMVGIGMVISWLITYYTIWSFIMKIIPLSAQLPETVQAINMRLLLTLVIPGFALLLLAGWVQVLMMHRIAGPAYRIQKTVNDLSQGIWQGHIKLRKMDMMKETVDAFNLFIESQLREYAQMEKKLREMNAILSQIDGKDALEKTRLTEAGKILESSLSQITAILPNEKTDESG